MGVRVRVSVSKSERVLMRLNLGMNNQLIN